MHRWMSKGCRGRVIHRVLQRVLLGLFLSVFLVPVQGWASHSPPDVLEVYLKQKPEVAQDVSHLFRSLAADYSQEVEKESQGAWTHPLSLNRVDGDPSYHVGSEHNRARNFAGHALRTMAKDKLGKMGWVRDFKSYARRLTFTQFNLSSDEVNFTGPSLRSNAPRVKPLESSKTSLLSVQSGMKVIGQSSVAFLLQAQMATLDSELLYQPLGGGSWEFLVGRTFLAMPGLKLGCGLRVTQSRDVMGTLNLTF